MRAMLLVQVQARIALETSELHGQAADEALQRSCDRLALVFNVEKDKLMAQVNDHMPMARKFMLETQCSTADAWRNA